MTTRLGTALMLLLLLLPLPRAAADPASDRLRQAAQAARFGAWAEVDESLPAPDELNREHVPLLWDVVSALGPNRSGTALRLLAAIRRLDPDADRPRLTLEARWSERPAPGILFREDLPWFPVESETLDLPAARGVPVAGDLPAATVVTVSPKPFLTLPPATEPRSGLAYQRVVTVYADGDGRLTLRFVVHHTAAVADERARQVGRFLGALSALSDRMLGRVSRARYPMHVWLSPNGAPGAEQWGDSILVHRADVDRSALEWARQLAHEWGHATLPGVEGFHEPEEWANGDLGERLYLPALSAAGWTAAWEKGLDVAPYTRRYVDPPRAAFARTGPVKALVGDAGRPGYDHFLGAALTVASVYGAPALAASLDDMESPSPAGFLGAFRRTLAARREWSVARPAALDAPVSICFPEAGWYILDGHGVLRDGRPVDGPARFAAGWVPLEWSGTLTVRRAPGPSAS